MTLYLAYAAIPLYALGAFFTPLLYAGFVAQALYLGIRGIELGRIPMVGLHDTLALFAASLVAFSLPFYRTTAGKRDFRVMLAASAAVLSVFSLLSKPHAGPLPPVLMTYWFEFHVLLSFFSYALFGIAAILGVLYLRDAGTDVSGGGPQRILSAQYKGALVGYFLFSLSMIFGGIWAYLAWGTYWLWTPKEIWTTILWLFYSLYLHARLLRGWGGKPAAVLGIVGFVVVLFTYLGVGLLMKSSHAF